MPRTQLYHAPPVIEAVVELKLKDALRPEILSRLAKSARQSYRNCTESGEYDVEIKLENGKADPRIGSIRPIYILSNADQNRFFRIELSKFHWSQMPPYAGWDEFLAQLSNDLEHFPRSFSFPSLERIGVRYRNRIDVPIENNKTARYEDYLQINISSPPILEPNDGYQWKIEKRFPNTSYACIVQSLIVTPEIPNTVATMLDIDIYRYDNFPKDSSNLKEILKEMRKLKNEIFESCITDKARNSFQ